MHITFRRPEEAARNRRRIKVFLKQLHRDAGVPKSKLTKLADRWSQLANDAGMGGKAAAFAQCSGELRRLVDQTSLSST